MRKRKVTIFVLFASFLLSFVANPPLMNALEVGTHELINERISFGDFDGFSLNRYLINQLGLSGGVNELFAGKDIFRWIRDGGRYEDEPPRTIPYLRSVNHFHNPLTEGGFSGLFFGYLLSGDSSVVWAQKSLHTQSPGGYYSWNDVKDYYFKGLTSINKAEREHNFAETFRGLGQVMHLVQDVSVPAHTRDDAHLVGYEKWVKKNININTTNSISFNNPILNRPTSGLPITNIFDTNQYNGGNPGIAVGNNIGLAEYTNANFFSEDTINSKSFPYPKIDSSTPIVDRPYLSIIGQPYFRKYYLKNCCGETNGGKGYLLSAVDYLDYWRLNFPILSLGLSKIPVLDDNVYIEYAKFLIPRALGYSSGLLKYFFRGKLQVTAVPIFHNNSIVYLRLKIKNMTPNETMIGGIFRLTYSYRPAGGNPDGSQDIWDQSPVVASGVLEYGGDDQHPVEDTVVDFWLPIPIPRENYDSAKFTLAFKGTLGNEGGAVIGKALTLGEVKFEEEWNNGLSGNHNWAHTGINLLGQNPDNGSTSNVLTGDTLVKDNIRYVGRKTARVNESYVGYDALNNEFVDILPIRITPNTYIQFKIDEMWINQRTPAPPGYTNDWQHLLLRFNNGLGIQYSTQEQGVYLGSKWGSFEFNPDFIIVDNIYDLFKVAGIPIPAGDLYLRNIAFIQQLSILDENSVVEHHQHMKIDSLRIIEGKKHE